jgi:hypothetical protein
MDKEELKRVLKPLIKECIKEVMFESGVLSKIVSEVAVGLTSNRQVLTESTSPSAPVEHVEENNHQREEVDRKLNEYKKNFAESVSKDNYGGVDLFEGTEALKSGGAPGVQQQMGPLANIEASDPGINIDGLIKVAGGTWNKLAKG